MDSIPYIVFKKNSTQKYIYKTQIYKVTSVQHNLQSQLQYFLNSNK